VQLFLKPSEDFLSENLHHRLAGFPRRSYEAGAVILGGGDLGRWAYFLVDGIVRVSLLHPSGVDRVVSFLKPKMLFGHAALFLGRPVTPSLVVYAHSRVVVTTIDAGELLELASEEPRFTAHLLHCVALQMADMHEHILLSTFGSTDERLAEVLAALVDEGHSDGRFTQDDLGRLIGRSRVSVNQALRRLEAGGPDTRRRQASGC
jgi:CRP/FNR family transcriptional regulator, cyclic AMP receptor protein